MSVATLFVGTGCTDKKATMNDSIIDTTEVDTVPMDSLETLLSEEPMPKAADELFDDFFFNFASSRKLQKERTDFPLPFSNMGKKSSVAKNAWARERFFMTLGYYTLIFNDRKQLEMVKDTGVSHVTVERVAFADNSLKQWKFNRVNGEWRLQNMSLSNICTHADAAFLKFYNEFATDTLFQMNSLAEMVHITAPDPEDDFSTIDGDLMAEQWPMFAPWMPSGELYNIHYGDKPYKASSTRLFVIRGIANGLETELTFKKMGESWKLTKMVN